MKYSAIITIPSHPESLSMLRTVVKELGDIHQISEGIINELKIALTEACANVIRHAYEGNTSRPITLKFQVSKAKIIVIIEDNGKKTDPQSVQGRELDNIKPHGLGVHLIKRTFDIFDFDMNKKDGNRLRLVKNLECV